MLSAYTFIYFESFAHFLVTLFNPIQTPRINILGANK